MDLNNLKATAELANLLANGLFVSETSSYYFHVQSVAKWLSCNGEPAGVGPTLVVASAAAVFLYHELRQSVRGAGGAGARLEKLLLSTMAVGALALLVHVWVCAARFFLYYLDTLLRESPCLLLELTTAGVLGARSEALLTPLTRFAREQQHQIHVTACWFLALCCADYVRKHYCETFNLPYLEQWWQAERAAAAHVALGAGGRGARRQLRGGPAAPAQCAAGGVWRGSMASELCPPCISPCCSPPLTRQSCPVLRDRSTQGSPVPSCRQSCPSLGLDEARGSCTALGRAGAAGGGPGQLGGWSESDAGNLADAFDQLRHYVQDTRCACAGRGGGGAEAGAAPAPQ
ncbi:uncharacterized protein LOC105388821 isoform X2 [Plutella xylostella]|uniref:uncharacterized protein LOC105388821 isoform X2 n=1 Tax=Plutella xylostella TaxID=51655 RepID=UPI0020331B3D|nr:uncharacterized protein LOC105388821 isoform X2 [Plutella xylostella]